MALQDLVNAADDNDIIDVSGQTFTNEYTTINKPLHIIGTGGVYTGPVVADGFANPCISLAANNIEFEGFDIDGSASIFKMIGKFDGFYAHDLLINRDLHKGGLIHWAKSSGAANTGGPTNMVLADIHYENGPVNSNGNGFAVGRSSEATPCDSWAEDCIVRDCYFGGTNTDGWFGFEIRCGRRFLMQRCTFTSPQEALTSWPESEDVEFDDCDFYLNISGPNPYWGIEQAGPHAHGFHVHHCRVHSVTNIDSGVLLSVNSIVWTNPDVVPPVALIECNTFVDPGVFAIAEGLSESTVRNNTIPAGTDVIYLEGTGNTKSNNDTDGASDATCAVGGLQQASAVLTAAASMIANGQVAHYSRMGARSGRGRGVI